MKVNKLLVFSGIIFFSSCGINDTSNKLPKELTLSKVYKYDGSIQCENGGISLEIMSQELTRAGIDIICAQKGSDGYPRIVMCGLPTGKINIFQINTVDLSSADNLGFISIVRLREYLDRECK